MWFLQNKGTRRAAAEDKWHYVYVISSSYSQMSQQMNLMCWNSHNKCCSHGIRIVLCTESERRTWGQRLSPDSVICILGWSKRFLLGRPCYLQLHYNCGVLQRVTRHRVFFSLHQRLRTYKFMQIYVEKATHTFLCVIWRFLFDSNSLRSYLGWKQTSMSHYFTRRGNSEVKLHLILYFQFKLAVCLHACFFVPEGGKMLTTLTANTNTTHWIETVTFFFVFFYVAFSISLDHEDNF